MRKASNFIFKIFIILMTVLTMFALGFVIYYIVSEALPVFNDVSPKDFIFGTKWMPVDYTGKTSFGIFNFILGTLYVSFLAMIIAVVIGTGCAVFLAFAVNERLKEIMYPFIDLLAGIPSVVYGFVGLSVLVKLLLKMGIHTGSCVLAGAIVLSVMLLPYLISSYCDSLIKLKEQYYNSARVLGVTDWHIIRTIIIPSSIRGLATTLLLAMGRAMGETMAVMMVMGNANVLPRLLGKGESIASVIALEMGTAVSGSTHYHALYAAGLVLMLLLLVIDILVSFIQHRLDHKTIK